MKTLADSLGLTQPAAPAPDTAPTKQSAKTLAKGILESSEYRRSIERRITSDTLPPAVECKLYDYAYGKPVDKVEIKDVTNRLEAMSDEQLATHLEMLRAKVAGLREPIQSIH